MSLLDSVSNTPRSVPATGSSLDTPGLDSISSGPSSPLGGSGLTLVGFNAKVEGPGGEIRIELERPIGGPDAVPLNELLQQIESLGNLPVPVFFLGKALDELTASAKAVALQTQNAVVSGNDDDRTAVADGAATVANGAQTIEQALRNIIENSTYPNFNDFLKEMVKLAQNLREQATKAKMAAIEANYQMMKSAADEMLTAAEEAKSKRDDEIAAERSAAIGQIVAGVVSFALTGITFGKTKDITFASNLGQSASNIITGITGSISAAQKSNASEHEYKSDLANVAKQRIEAAAKLIEQQTTIADDLRDIAKNLRDMALKVYEDMVKAHNEIIQRANV